MARKLDTIGTIQGSMQDLGWRASGQIFGDAAALDWYKPVKSWFNLYADGWEAIPRLAFSGHLIPDEFERTVTSSVAPWTAYTAQEWLKRGRVQGVFYKSVAAAPANNHQIVDMTYSKIVEELLGIVGQNGHCNLVEGVWPEGFLKLDIDHTNSVPVDQYEVREGQFLSSLVEIANIERYILFVDRYNVLHYIPHPMFGATLPTPVFTLDSDWLLSPLRVTPRNTRQVGQVKIYGSTPAGEQLVGRYPNDPTTGPVVTSSGYKATSATQIATVASRQYNYENRDVSVVARVPGAVGLLVDLMDRIAVDYQVAADGISWVGKKFWIDAITVNILSNFTASTEFELEAESAG